MVPNWFLPSLSEVLAQSEEAGWEEETAAWVDREEQIEPSPRGMASRRERARLKAEREWRSAIATLETLLLQTSLTAQASCQGLILSGPVPVLSHAELLSRFRTGIFTTEASYAMALMPFQLPPAQHQQHSESANTACELPLLPADSLAAEQFCLVFTEQFSLVMVAGEDNNGIPAFRFSFAPEDVERAWASLCPRMLLMSPHQFSQLETLVKQFVPKPPDYRLVMAFSRQLLKNLPEPSKAESVRTIPVPAPSPTAQSEPAPNPEKPFKSRRWQRLLKNEEQGSNVGKSPEAAPDVELLQALTHEIRTPLTTIRTLTKLLLKRKDIAPEVRRRLEIIDRECTEQINRMELIFRAVELETTATQPKPVNLTSISLAQIFQQSIPRWQKQAQRRNLTLDVVLPQKLPTVVSNPAMLEQVLTGLVENFTRSLPAGGHIQLQVMPAGEQLKLQFQSQSDGNGNGRVAGAANKTCSTLRSIGQLLNFQPETGSLSLNLDVTKHLFQALGGKLIVRQRPQEGEVMTIFLPLEVNQSGKYGCQEIFIKK